MNADIFESYIPKFSQVRDLQSTMPSSLNSPAFPQEANFEKYLCAIAYSSLAKQILANQTIPAAYLKNDAFCQGMLTNTILEVVDFVKKQTENTVFKRDKTLDVSQFKSIEDNSKIIFMVYYLRTQGYNIIWNKEKGQKFDPIKLHMQGKLTFEQTTKANAKECMNNTMECVVLPVRNL